MRMQIRMQIRTHERWLVSNPLTIALGKIVQRAAQMRGGGSALPGLVVEKLEPRFAVDILAQLPRGVVLITGTNGKTTTVKIVVELLESQGLRVFTNNTGSNFMRGVISSLLRRVSLAGRLDADIAVLELDEAHAVNFVELIRPRYALLLNVMRDQLDRFGEIDYTARLLRVVARSTTGVVVINREDRRLAVIPGSEQLQAQVRWYGLAPELRQYFPEDDELYGGGAGRDEDTQGTDKTVDETDKATRHKGDEVDRGTRHKGDEVDRATRHKGDEVDRGTRHKGDEVEQDNDSYALKLGMHELSPCPKLSPVGMDNPVILHSFEGSRACFEVDGIRHSTTLALKGIYNVQNAAAALALVHAVLPEASVEALVAALTQVKSAFGRGETLVVDGAPVELLLVKNPGGFRLALQSQEANAVNAMSAADAARDMNGTNDASTYATMIAINDDYADGRDMSWLFDVDFTSLRAGGVAMVAGVRAYDMALRLHYDEVPFVAVERDLSTALHALLTTNPNKPKRLYCTYTAMLQLRKLLSALTDVERVL
jgi:UDP-N-acetylmuramyl tripeptide synthase